MALPSLVTIEGPETFLDALLRGPKEIQTHKVRRRAFKYYDAIENAVTRPWVLKERLPLLREMILVNEA